MDLGSLPTDWAVVARLHAQIEQTDNNRSATVLTARLLDEAQTAGPRTYITAHRYLQIAFDNHSALIGLLQHHGATPWAPWNLMRPVFEAAFYVLWILDPDQGRDRRRRGLRAEVMDFKEQRKWVESLTAAGLSNDTVQQLNRRRTEVTQIYQQEAAELSVTWDRTQQAIQLTAEIPKIQALLETHGNPGTALFVSTWRRLSGFQHGLSYALQVGAEVTKAVTIPGGQTVHLTINDEDFVNTAKLTSALHMAALQLYLRRSTQVG